MADRTQTHDQRLEAIRRLLAHRYDHLPEPRRRDHASSGFVHRTDALETCPDCFGETPGRVGCSTCRGAGTVRVRRDRDPYAVNAVQRYGMTGTQHDQARERDRQISRLADQLAPPMSEQEAIAHANEHPYGWEIARARMYAAFDFRALDVALERLRHALPDVAPGSDRGLRFIEPHMPDPVRAPEEDAPITNLKVGRGMHAHPDALKARARLITDWVLKDGMPVQWVAWKADLSVSQVNAIVRGEAA